MILDRHSLRFLKSLTASMYTSNISTSPDHAVSLGFVVIAVTTIPFNAEKGPEWRVGLSNTYVQRHLLKLEDIFLAE